MKIPVLIGLAAFFGIMSLIEFVLMGSDKKKAKAGAWRIKEKTLLLMSVFGGSVGALAGMYTFRHKTKHWYFVATFWGSLILHLAVFIAAAILIP